ncbi:MAG: sulfatase-like hydrolase/transferase, partial [Gemmataceae bacterium]
TARHYSGTPLEKQFHSGSNPKGGVEQQEKAAETTRDLCADAVAVIRASTAEKPFLLFVSHYAPHVPIVGRAEELKRFAKKYQPGTQSHSGYAATLADMDAGFGAMLDALDAKGITNNTIVIFTSDNGGLVTDEGRSPAPTTNAPLREGKGYLYEGGLRVPLIIRGPATMKSPGKPEIPVSTMDLLPTLCEWCQLPIPKNLDGVSFPKEVSVETRPLFWHYPHYSNQTGKPGGAVHDGQWKWIHFYETDREELFDLSKDPNESRNIAAGNPKECARLRALHADWLKTMNAQMPTKNSNYRGVTADKNGDLILPARLAIVTGTQLRFEPMPHKNCLGYWTDAKDTASWDFSIEKPGTFNVIVKQGCGSGQGGSRAKLTIGTEQREWTVEETGGFQNFRPVSLGKINLKTAGLQTLRVEAISKAKAAVMDIRSIELRPVTP